jgi:hypothetical protein
MFKIAQYVLLNDKRRARVMREVSPRRYEVMVFGGGLEVHAAGDLALPGEDAAIVARELAIISSASVTRPGRNPDDV